MSKIVVEDYNPQWAEDFKALKQVYSKHLGDIRCYIEHVGSTAVEGLAAKPIIDIDIVVYNPEDVKKVINRLEKIGYKHMGQMGIKGREAFKPVSDKVPFTPEKRRFREHHLYCIPAGEESLENHLRLRDFLREHPEAVEEYSTVKKRLAEKYPDNIDAYIDEKTATIVSILEKAGMERGKLDEIEGQNKQDGDGSR